MRGVTRGLTLLSTLLVALIVAMPVSAAEGRSVKGVLVAFTSSTVAFKDSKGVVTTCLRGAKSPSLDGYATGDRVQAACVRVSGKLVLVKIRRVPAANDSSPNDSSANSVEPTKFSGAITALTDGQITLHDGDRDFTCSIGPSSPSTAGVKVGQHVTVACSNGALVAIAPVTSGRAYEGIVSAVDTTSITVHTPSGDGTCTIGADSPSTADVKVGDRVLAGCTTDTNHLVLLKKLPSTDAPPPADDSHTVTVGGTLTALSSSSLTVHGEHGDVSCTVPATARLGDFHVGDHVGMACTDGILLKLVKL